MFLRERDPDFRLCIRSSALKLSLTRKPSNASSHQAFVGASVNR